MLGFLAFPAANLHAQLYFHVGNYRPTGELGLVLKPTISYEAGYTSGIIDDDNKWRTNATLTFIKGTPRLDTFPVTTVQSGGNGTIILPGKQSFSKYNLIFISFGFDYPFYFNDRFSAYGGFDIQGGSAGVSYYYYVPTLKEETYDGGGFLGGIRFRLGFDYHINDALSISATAMRHGMLITEPAALVAANDYGVGLRYMFK